MKVIFHHTESLLHRAGRWKDPRPEVIIKNFWRRTPHDRHLENHVSSFCCWYGHNCMQVVIGKGHKVNGHKRISLCRQTAVIASDSEDEREVPNSTAASSTFGSADSDGLDTGVKPSNNVISYANAAAAGNSVPSEAYQFTSWCIDKVKQFMSVLPAVGSLLLLLLLLLFWYCYYH